ncbi:helix-turn-helix domain-containing protein [Thermoleophilia bacterium SCSIO 60948]|nr:helix-turn-helix domain-containing protein [Thermoleophilia bacterium SCSIO 60948]
MRDLHSRMLSALLAGGGLEAVAELAAEEAGGPVCIAIPRRGLAAGSGRGADVVAATERSGALLRGVSPDSLPGASAEIPIEAAGTPIGHVTLLAREPGEGPAIDPDPILRTAALAALAEVAVADARDEVTDRLRGSLLEDLRHGAAEPSELVRRAARLGCDLSSGAMALVAKLRSERPRHAAALITGELPGTIAEPLPAVPGVEGELRIYALLPVGPGDGEAERVRTLAARIARRLRPYGPAAYSSVCRDPAELGRAVDEAELMVEVVDRDARLSDQLADGSADGVYRLLFRALATDPTEVRRFYSETVEPLVAHDRSYRTDLLGTLDSYLANDCNMNATARAVYAHRHTVAHRLGRIRELTGLDPALGEHRERLGLGIKAYRIIAPTLPR